MFLNAMRDFIYQLCLLTALFCAAVSAAQPDSGAVIWSIETGG